MVNKALLEMLVGERGPQFWDEVSRDAGVDRMVFLRNQFFPDALTSRLAKAACVRLNEPTPDFLRRFGRFFVREADRLNYGDLFNLIGTTMREFLLNLPSFHSRIALMFPEQAPPSFSCTKVTDTSLELHCSSCRTEALPFVIGTMEGYAERFAVRLKVLKQVPSAEKYGFDSFVLQWEN